MSGYMCACGRSSSCLCEIQTPVTAASGADQPTLRDELAEALFEWTAVSWSDDDRRHIADALLPLIEADRERAKAEGGAEALEKAAMHSPAPRNYPAHLLRLASSLRAEAGGPA